MKNYIIKRPMLLCAISCLAIAVAGYCSDHLLIIAIILTFFISGFILLNRISPQTVFITALIFIMILSTVITKGKIASANKANGVKCTAEITICEIAGTTSDYYSATVYIRDCKYLKSGTKLKVFFEPLNLTAGEIVRADITLKSISNNSYKASSYSEGIYLTANIKNIKSLNKYNFVITAVSNIRKYIRKTLFSDIAYDEAATLCALIFGDKSYFTDEFYSNVGKAGVSHIMVVSGMHLSILVLLFTYITERFIYNRHLKAVTMLAVVLLLSLLCGFTMSILRAGITYVIAAAALIIKRNSTPANTLGAAVTVILISSPFAVFSVALQLSVLSTFGILAVAAPVINYVSQNKLIRSKLLFNLFANVFITLSAALMTLPVTIYTFGSISVVAIFTNLLISYAVTLLICLAICGLIMNLVLPDLAHFIFIPCGLTAKYINSVINFFGGLDFSVIAVDRKFTVSAVFLIIFIFWLLLACKRRIDMIKLKEMRDKLR